MWKYHGKNAGRVETLHFRSLPNSRDGQRLGPIRNATLLRDSGSNPIVCGDLFDREQRREVLGVTMLLGIFRHLAFFFA